MTQPSFFVQNGSVTWCNAAAHPLITRSVPLAMLLGDCEPIYTAWNRTGTLHLPIRLFEHDYDACVRPLADGDLFLANPRSNQMPPTTATSMEVLSSSLCHALHSLLNASRTLFDLIQDKADEPTMEAAAQLNRSIYQISRIYGKLTDGGRLLQHRTEAIRLPTRMQDFLSDFAFEAKSLVSAAGICFVYEPLSAPISADVDAKLLLLSLYGLLAILLCYTPKDGEVALSAEKQGQYLRIRIHNTGSKLCGAVAETLFSGCTEQVLEDAVQSPDIGLPMVREIARLHGGSLVLGTTENNGTVATLSISLAPCDIPLNSTRLSGANRFALHPGLVVLSGVLPPSVYRPDEVE